MSIDWRKEVSTIGPIGLLYAALQDIERELAKGGSIDGVIVGVVKGEPDGDTPFLYKQGNKFALLGLATWMKESFLEEMRGTYQTGDIE